MTECSLTDTQTDGVGPGLGLTPAGFLSRHKLKVDTVVPVRATDHTIVMNYTKTPDLLPNYLLGRLLSRFTENIHCDIHVPVPLRRTSVRTGTHLRDTPQQLSRPITGSRAMTLGASCPGTLRTLCEGGLGGLVLPECLR